MSKSVAHNQKNIFCKFNFLFYIVISLIVICLFKIFCFIKAQNYTIITIHNYTQTQQLHNKSIKIEQDLDLSIAITNHNYTQNKKLHNKNIKIQHDSELSISLPRHIFLGRVLQKRKALTGVELGVQRGIFSKNILSQWPNAQQYLLVDLWKPMTNYVDSANVNSQQANSIFKEALENTRQWNVKICRNLTSECAKIYHNSLYDFIYVDARHDYNGVYEDLKNWFPKLTKNGIIAGHDYMTAGQQSKLRPSDKWEINGDGSIDITKRSVLGAVDDFFGLMNYPLQIIDTKNNWKTWLVDTSNEYPSSHIPSRFHFIWVSCKWHEKQEPIPEEVLARIDQWKRMYPTWYIVVWTNVLIEEHFPVLYKLFQKINTEAWVSDILRYHVIAKYGGIYLDTDIIPLRKIPSDLLKTTFTVCERPRDTTFQKCFLACNAIIASTYEHPEIKVIAQKAVDVTKQKINQKHQSHSNRYDVALTGPRLWSEYLKNSTSTITTLTSKTFYPCDWKDRTLCKKDKYIHDYNVFAMHLWKHSWA